MTEKNEMVKVEAAQTLAPMAISDVVRRTALVQEVLEKVMIKDVHYGLVPGCGTKPTLLKPGSEKLCLTFRMAPEYIIEKTDLPGGHREYEIICMLYSIPEHAFLGSGVATATTMETKWRFRNAAAVCPKCGVAAIIKGKTEYGGGWVCFKKKEGCGAKFSDDAPEIVNQPTGKVENENPADQHNTVKKMSAKRALAAATINATAASDIFAQDLEDLKANGVLVEAEKVVVKDAEVEKELAPEPAQGQEQEQEQEPAPERSDDADDDVDWVHDGPVPRCPVCQGDMWDNRETRVEQTAEHKAGTRSSKPGPSFKCKDKECKKGAVWSYHDWLEKNPAAVNARLDSRD